MFGKALMRILVTGAAGFVGRHMIDDLTRHGHEPLALDVAFPDPTLAEPAARFTADIRDSAAIEAAFRTARPDACVHLSAIAFVPDGENRPETMLSVNIAGTMILLDTLKRHAPDCKTLVVSTAQIYAPQDHESPVAEDAPLAPANLYAVSKAASDIAALGYARRFGLPLLTARPNNHTGPGQSSSFVVPALIRQAQAIAAGRTPPVIHAGNLESQRVFADVRDVVVAYRLLLEHGAAGEAYNVSAGDNRKLGAILDRICAMAGIDPSRETDPDKVRPTDRSPVLNTEKIRGQTGWTPRIPFDQTLRDMLAEDDQP